MTHPYDKAEAPFDWMFASVSDWGRLLMVAQELRHADGECLDALRGEHTDEAGALSQEDAIKVRSLVQMMRSLGLDVDAIRRLQPTQMPTLETACSGCTERNRCDRELAQGTAAENRAEFCPNTPQLNALLATTAAG